VDAREVMGYLEKEGCIRSAWAQEGRGPRRGLCESKGLGGVGQQQKKREGGESGVKSLGTRRDRRHKIDYFFVQIRLFSYVFDN
jgi:hypothetical protein